MAEARSNVKNKKASSNNRAEMQGSNTKDDIIQECITYPGWGGESAPPDSHENSMHIGSDEDREIFCDPCEIDGQKHLAEGYCKNCEEFLCTTCYINHRKYKPTRHHILLDKHEMPTIKNVHLQKDACTDHCTYHKDTVIEYYCKSCDQFGCSHCFVVGHRNCSVVHIQDIVSGLEKSNEFKLFKDRLAKLKGRLRLNGTIYHSNRSAVDVFQGRAKRDIRKQRNTINAFFDKLEKQVDSEIDRIRNEDTELVEDVAKTSKQLASEFHTKLYDYEQKEKLGQRCQLFVDMKTSGDFLKEIEENMSRMNEENKIHRYELLLSEEVLNIMENLKQIAVLFKKYSVWRRKPIFDGKVNMQAASDRDECNVTGMCLLKRNLLFAADSSNMCVKVVDVEHAFRPSNIICIVTMPSWPWDISKISDEQLAVTLPIVGQVRFLTQRGGQGGRWFADRTIDVGLECRGIEYSRGNLIVSFSLDPGIVKILTLNGIVLNVFSTGQDGQQLFSRPNYLALGLDHNLIYVSDLEKHTVTSLDRYGNVKDVSKIDDVRSPGGLAVDRTDSLFVCGSGYYNVNQLYSDLTQVQILLDHSNAEERPQCITYCGATNMIFIGMQDKSFVNVFKLV